eukprot:10536059-Heterocapsa_arctica.AAC.1
MDLSALTGLRYRVYGIALVATMVTAITELSPSLFPGEIPYTYTAQFRAVKQCQFECSRPFLSS